ncbi:MAG: SusC/RagA family TonB-linked outer membrane protein [Tannerellaceae bacterium]|nr:SusC/RagA family TonB-linked outer membrane protein [Tannerellaceae bacterium]
MDVNRRISCRLQTDNIYEILNFLSEQLHVRYEIMDIQILLLPPDKEGTSRLSAPVTGRILDENGQPMEYVSIYDELSGKGALTTENGLFHLYTGADSCRLRISYLGYETQFTGLLTMPYHMNIHLVPAIYRLQDVVAVGYGTLTRRELTAAVGYVSSEEFLMGKVNNPIMGGVKGLVSGVSISGSSLSDINSNPDIQIRGAGSILAGNNPLIVVDGIPGVSLNSLSVSDIESVSILKDGFSAAIYGSNGANGVILITTKTGKTGGKLQATYNTYIALSGVAGKPAVLSPEEFILRGRDVNLRSRTDWFKEITRSAPFEHYHDFSIQNGWEGGALRFSGNFRDGDGLDIASSRKEYALRSFLQQSLLSGHLEITASLAYKKQAKQIGNHEAFQQAVVANPTAPVYRYESTGSYYYPTGFSMDNPVAMLKEETHRQDNQFITGSVTGRVNFRKGLYAQVVMAENREDLEESAYWTSQSKESVDNNRKGRAERIEARQVHRMVEWTNHYDASLNGHSWKGLLGYSWQRWDNSSMEVGNANFPTDFFTWNNLGTGSYLQEGKATLASSRNMSKLISLFARVNYSYKELVMLSASFRREGSSKFGANHKWGNFPALSAGLRVTEFAFFQSPFWLDDMKLRTGYGVSGRHQLSPYQSLETYSGAGQFFSNGTWIQVFGPENNPNPDLRWEKSLHTNIGIEAVLFKSSLVLSLDYYRRTTKDLLFEYNAIKPPMIHDRIVTNIGSIDSDGLEWEVVWRPVRREGIHFTTTFTGNYNRRRLRSLSDSQFTLGYTYLYDLPAPGLPGPAIRLEEGMPIGAFYGFRYAGVDPDGNIQIRTKSGEVVNASERVEEDKEFIGNGVPKVQLAWSNTVKWKNIQMRFFFTSWLGYDILNLKQLYYGLQNQPVINVLQDTYSRNEHIKGEKIYCDYFLEKGNFLKLEEVSIGYKFPLGKNQWIESIEGYLAVNNVYTFTRYTGTDPSNININGVEPGIESLSVYPVTRTFTLGFSVRF